MTDFGKLCGRRAREQAIALIDACRQTHAALAQSESEELRDLRTRIETLEAALHKHIMQTSSSTETSKVLDVSDLPQLTPEQMRNLKDLLGTYRNHLGLNDSMPKLSPAAKAVLDAAYRRMDENPHNEVEATIAAALQAAVADQPYDVPQWCRGDYYLMYRHVVDDERDRLLAIAAELEAQ